MPFVTEKGDAINYKVEIEKLLKEVCGEAGLSPDSPLVLVGGYYVAKLDNKVMEASHRSKLLEDMYTFMVIKETKELGSHGGMRREREIDFVTEGSTPTVCCVDGEVAHILDHGAYTPGLGFEIFKESKGEWSHKLFPIEEEEISLARELTKRYHQ